MKMYVCEKETESPLCESVSMVCVHAYIHMCMSELCVCEAFEVWVYV